MRRGVEEIADLLLHGHSAGAFGRGGLQQSVWPALGRRQQAVGDVDTCVAQAVRIGAGLVTQRVVGTTQHQRGSQVGQAAGGARHGVGMFGVHGAAQVLLPAVSPLAAGGGFIGGLALGGGAHTRVEHGRQKDLPGQGRVGAVTRHHGHGRGQVATSLFTGQEHTGTLARQFDALFVHPFEYVVTHLDTLRKRAGRRKWVGQRHHHRARTRQHPRHCGAVVQPARHKGSAVEVQHQRCGGTRRAFAVQARVHRRPVGQRDVGIGLFNRCGHGGGAGGGTGGAG